MNYSVQSISLIQEPVGHASLNQSKLKMSKKQLDSTHDSRRIEVTCRKCGSHLGHVLDDRRNPRKRYCINAVALKLDNRS
jgi:peptide methionine sulfoxide reductase MsrB